jgi:hypothetical protein
VISPFRREIFRGLRLVAVTVAIPALSYSGAFAAAGDDAGALSTSADAFIAEGADTCLDCHNGEDMLLIFRTPHGQGADADTTLETSWT